MKALVLAAGRGKRLGVHSDEQSKCMLPMFGKPLIQYSLENAARAGVSEIVVVVGYRAETVINEFGIGFEGARVRYVLQDDPAVSLIAVAIAATPSAVADTIVLLEQNRSTFALIQSECGGKTTDAEVAKAFEEFDSKVFTIASIDLPFHLKRTGR